MDGRIDMSQTPYELCDLTHDLDFQFSRLDFENNNHFRFYFLYHSFFILGSGRQSRGDIKNVGISVTGILVSLMSWYKK